LKPNLYLSNVAVAAVNIHLLFKLSFADHYLNLITKACRAFSTQFVITNKKFRLYSIACRGTQIVRSMISFYAELIIMPLAVNTRTIVNMVTIDYSPYK
jgi:hypothetical protein